MEQQLAYIPQHEPNAPDRISASPPQIAPPFTSRYCGSSPLTVDLVNKARKHPDIYLKKLALLPVGEQELILHPSILQLFLEQFNCFPPAAISCEHSKGTVYFAIVGLGFVIQLERSRDIKQQLESVWPNMWPWMDFLYRHLILDGHHEFDITLQRLLVEIEAILAFLLDDTPSHMVVTTPGVLSLVVKMYLWQGDSQNYNRKEIAQLVPPSAAFISLLRSPLTDFNEVIEVVGYNRRSAAGILCNAFQVGAVYGGEEKMWTTPFSDLLKVHLALATRSLYFYRWLSPEIVMTIASNSLDHFTSLSHTREQARYANTHESIEALLAFFVHYATHVATGHSWVIFALRSKLIPSLIRAIIYFEQVPAITADAETLIELLQTYTLHPPVLDRLQNETKESLVDAQAVTHTGFRVRWFRLTDVIEHIKTIRTNFNASGCYLPLCEFDKCAVQKGSWRGKRCSGCKIAIYCSPECQRRDWGLHRNACRDNRPSRDTLESPRSLAFFQFVVEQDMTSAQEAIAALRDKYLSAYPTQSPLSLVMDYSLNIPQSPIIQAADGSDLDSFPSSRVPLLLPYIRIRDGRQLRDFIVQTDVSGDLFGWIDS
ncbi:hypothetical protein DXG01_008373 [Tephrocybe rancida]|nr:hypothetical protein DXG01_008373 [Tephrocybe rancida]